MDIDSICTKPLLQSAYAETLRLYTSLFTLRSPTHEDFHLGVWKISQDKLIAVDCRVAHMDSRFWNTRSCSSSLAEDSEGSHPLKNFWTTTMILPAARYGISLRSRKSLGSLVAATVPGSPWKVSREPGYLLEEDLGSVPAGTLRSRKSSSGLQ